MSYEKSKMPARIYSVRGLDIAEHEAACFIRGEVQRALHYQRGANDTVYASATQGYFSSADVERFAQFIESDIAAQEALT